MPLRHRKFQSLKVDAILSIGLNRVPHPIDRAGLDGGMAVGLRRRFYAGFVNFRLAHFGWASALMDRPIFLALHTPHKNG